MNIMKILTLAQNVTGLKKPKSVRIMKTGNITLTIMRRNLRILTLTQNVTAGLKYALGKIPNQNVTYTHNVRMGKTKLNVKTNTSKKDFSERPRHFIVLFQITHFPTSTGHSLPIEQSGATEMPPVRLAKMRKIATFLHKPSSTSYVSDQMKNSPHFYK